MTNPVLIEARHIAKSYLLPTLFLRKYKDFFTDVDFRIRRGEIVGLAGPSGVGKSTLGRLIIGLDEPSRGEMLIEGIPASRWRTAPAGWTDPHRNRPRPRRYRWRCR